MRQKRAVGKGKAYARLFLESYGLTPVTLWIEARKLKHGFSVVMGGDADFFSRPKRIASTRKSYNWQLFAEYICGLDEGWIGADAHSRVIVEGESGIRADTLRLAWSYPEGESTLVNWLLMQDEDTIDFLESTIVNIIDEKNLAFLSEFCDNAQQLHGDTTLNELFHFHFSLRKLNTAMEKRIEKDTERKVKEREREIEPFRKEIERIVSHFDDKRPHGSHGIRRPSKRWQVQNWLEQYVVKNKALPVGEQRVTTSFYGSTISLDIDFSKI